MTQDAAPLAESTEPSVRPGGLSRRATVPLIAAAVGASGYLIAACSSDSSTDDATASSAASAAAPSAASTAAATSSESSDEGTELATLDQVPAGGGVILKDQKIVLTRTSGNDVKGFSAVCTHQGCLVGEVANGTINCPCHGSKYDASTGAVVNGPATAGLKSVPVTVRDNEVYMS
jgi:Rieske Fe-S protein